MMKKIIILLLFIVLLSQLAFALKVSTTPLNEGVLYVNPANRYFYIYITNDGENPETVRITMQPNSDYKFADSEFAFLYEQEVFPEQSIKVPIKVNNIGSEFALSYKVTSETFNTYDSFITMPEHEVAKRSAAGYTLILTLFALAIMIVLYIWNRFVYHSYKIDYQQVKHKRKKKRHHQTSSSAKL